jgi:AcrR family transcriptional regulator
MARSTLRDRLDHTTRETILDALVPLLAERGAFEFSYFELARRGGFSVRTIYRHFPTRDDLFDALGRRLTRAITFDFPRTREGVVGVMARVFDAYDRNSVLVAAQLQTGLTRTRQRARNRRTNLMQAILDAGLPHLDPARRTAAAGLLTCLFSANNWQRLHEEVGLDGARSGAIVAWAVDTLWRALEAEDDRARRKRTSALP